MPRPRYLEKYGVDCSGCMTQSTLEAAIGSSLRVPKLPAAREGCACLLGADIGAYDTYDTCGHLCRYCYANSDRQNVTRNRRLHDPDLPLLVGHLGEGEVIHQAVQESWIDGQLSLF